MKSIEKKLHSFTAVFIPALEGGYVVYVPALPGCATQGETFEEARINAKDAVELYIGTMKELSENMVPELEGTVIARISVAV